MPPDASPSPRPRVQLMASCLCDALFPDAAIATVELLERLGCDVHFPRAQTCCGQPAFNAGDFRAARRVVRHMLDVFAGEEPIVIPSGSCAAMCKSGSLLLFEGEPDLPAVRDLARRCWELTDFVVNRLPQLGALPGLWPLGLTPATLPASSLRPTPSPESNEASRTGRRLALHHSCHTRGTPSRAAAMALLASIPGVELLEIDQPEQCCGFGGLFSIAFPTVSTAIGRLKLDHIRRLAPDLLVSLDTSCLMHLSGLAARDGRPLPTRHIAEVLRDALEASS